MTEPYRFSINRAAEEFGRDRRVVKRALKHVAPDGQENGHPVWSLQSLLAAFRAYDAPRSRGEPRLPPVFAPVSRAKNPIDKTLVMTAIYFMLEMPNKVAWSAIFAGADCKTAFATMIFAAELTAKTAREIVDQLTDGDVERLEVPRDAIAIDWEDLARAAGEPVDLEGWGEHYDKLLDRVTPAVEQEGK